MIMEFVMAKPEHLQAICSITEEAKVQLKRIGTDQWQQGYPNESVWADDIEKGISWVALEGGKVVGAFAFIVEPEASYEAIEGKWLTDTPYVSLHRFCVAEGCKRQGVAGRMFSFAFEKARKAGFKSVRIDTHPGNFPMQKALEKSAFIKCGIIYLIGGAEDGHARFAYEKLL